MRLSPPRSSVTISSPCSIAKAERPDAGRHPGRQRSGALQQLVAEPYAVARSQVDQRGRRIRAAAQRGAKRRSARRARHRCRVRGRSATSGRRSAPGGRARALHSFSARSCEAGLVCCRPGSSVAGEWIGLGVDLTPSTYVPFFESRSRSSSGTLLGSTRRCRQETRSSVHGKIAGRVAPDLK